MDDLRRDDIAQARAASPAQKLRQALDAMRMGLAMQRSKLRRLRPEATDAELEQLYQAWLFRDD